MNKKGFTLIEVIISLVLVSVVIVSMLASLVKVKEAYTLVYENSDALIYSSSISRIINNDITKNGGIKYINCDLNGNSCDLVLGTDDKRRLEVYSVDIGTNQAGSQPSGISRKITVDDNIYCEKINDCTMNNGVVECNCNEKLIASVLKYTDTNNTSSDTEKILYIKTLKLRRVSSYNKDAAGKYTLSKENNLGYTFGKINSNILKLESANKKKNAIPYINSLVNISIQIYDGTDSSDTTYAVSLYATSTYPPDSIRVGDEIILQLNSGEIGSATVYYDELILKYARGFYVYKENKETGEKVLTPVTELPLIPVSNNGKKFLGYYISKDVIADGTGVLTPTNIKIIDENGKILVDNKYFNSSNDIPILTALWE